MIASLQNALYITVGVIAAGVAGVAFAWWLRRRTMVSIRNVYLAALAAAALDVVAARMHVTSVLAVSLPLTAGRGRDGPDRPPRPDPPRPRVARG